MLDPSRESDSSGSWEGPERAPALEGAALAGGRAGSGPLMPDCWTASFVALAVGRGINILQQL